MSERREVMKVTVTWFTSDPDDAVEYAMAYLDEHAPAPVDWVSQAIHAGATPIEIVSDHFYGRGFEILVEGPEKWRATNGIRGEEVSDST